MIDPNDAQSGLIAYAKSKTTLTALLTNGGATEIREAQWQGTEFAYPALRLSHLEIYPIADCNCCGARFSWMAYSENASSHEANALAAEVADQFHNKSFIQGSVRYVLYSNGIIPTIRENERTWRSEVRFRAILEPTA